METLSPVANEIANWLRQTREAMPGFAEDCVRGHMVSAVFFAAFITVVALPAWGASAWAILKGARENDDDTLGFGIFVGVIVTVGWLVIVSANTSTYIHATWGPRAFFVAECLRK